MIWARIDYFIISCFFDSDTLNALALVKSALFEYDKDS